jgi:glutathione peroxidase
MSTLFDIPVNTIAGEPSTLAPFQGRVLLIVNVASKCGLTPQYEGLEKLYETYKHCGFDILAFPANKTFCTTNFGVTFPLFEKIAVTGPATHPLYGLLTSVQPVARINDAGFRGNLDGFLSTLNPPAKTNPLPGILWNFEKFLVNRRGQVVARFAPDTLPNDPAIIQAIERELPPLDGSTHTHA